AVECRDDVELGQLEGEDRGPLLATRGEGRQIPAVELEDEVVTVRPDQRRSVPDLLLGGLGQAPGEGVPRQLPGEWRRVGLVAEGQPCCGGPRAGAAGEGV